MIREAKPLFNSPLQRTIPGRVRKMREKRYSPALYTPSSLGAFLCGQRFLRGGEALSHFYSPFP